MEADKLLTLQNSKELCEETMTNVGILVTGKLNMKTNQSYERKSDE